MCVTIIINRSHSMNPTFRHDNVVFLIVTCKVHRVIVVSKFSKEIPIPIFGKLNHKGF